MTKIERERADAAMKTLDIAAPRIRDLERALRDAELILIRIKARVALVSPFYEDVQATLARIEEVLKPHAGSTEANQ